MRIALLGFLLAVSMFAHAEDRSFCKKRDPSSEQSWNPSAAGVTPNLRHFYDLGHELEWAKDADDLVQVEKVAKEYLAVAEGYRCNWNYGNAFYDGNSALGLVALANGNKDLAVKYLLESAKSPGSPQLDSFGPAMTLANKLVSAGENNAVISYLEGIHAFWRMDNGEVEKWIGQLRGGGKPDFLMQLR
jgi:hypothetical protein